MGRELQKKKNKSSIPKKRQKGPSKKKILQNPIIAKHWDQKETLSQNYRRLGLTSRLNHATGGTEKTIGLLGLDDPKSPHVDPAAKRTPDILNGIPRASEVKEIQELEVERDPETGAIIRVLEQQEKIFNPLNDPLNELDDGDGQEWSGFSMVPEQREGEDQNPVIQQLEQLARNGARKPPRKQSQREGEWIERLVSRYGEDYERMARDRKLNPMQQTAADIRKRVGKWKAS